MNTIEFLRQFRIGEFTLFDSTFTLILAYLLAPLLTKIAASVRLAISRKSWLLLTLPIGVLVHKIVGADTPMSRYFFDPSGHYFLKTIIFMLAYLGLKDITIIRPTKRKKKANSQIK